MNAVAARPELELHGLVVLRDGSRVLEQYWAPYVADDRALVYSASKTFTASAIALAIGRAIRPSARASRIAPISCRMAFDGSMRVPNLERIARKYRSAHALPIGL